MTYSEASTADDRKEHQNKDNSQDTVNIKGEKSSESDTYKKPTSTTNASEQLTDEEQKQVTDLKRRDTEVRAHEQAHASVGGQYAGAPSYEFQTGPDGKKYAVGGEVSIDVSEAKDAQATIQKMQIVRRAAMAPAEPSSQDFKVAAEATQKEQAARAELNKGSEDTESTAIKENQNKLAQYAEVESVITDPTINISA
ncbi:putative metalloprotease CJM1_0395 family protein [Glaciecola sp. 1036]|uniref:putative metalloprotease CJM1_0395 family protein n=1 Tax=Alteromonadaceae TaxID=72275 RepID=UPI003CFF06F4